MKKSINRIPKPKLRLELKLYGKKDFILQNLKDAVEWFEKDITPETRWHHYNKGIDFCAQVTQLKPEDWFPGKKERAARKK